MQLLDIRNLTLEIDFAGTRVRAVDKVNLRLKEGEFHGLVGESGSGKSLIAKTIIGVLDDKWHVSADRIHWRGEDILRLSVEERREIIHRDIAMIFQEPSSCLDPTTKLGEQLEEAIPDKKLSGFFWQKRQQRRQQAIKLLHQVGIKKHSQLMDSYPDELSEGMCQKVMIAMAIAKEPLLLIADEPTTSMESLTEAQIFRLLAKLKQVQNMAILLISHDLDQVWNWCQQTTVLYCGQAVESGHTQEIFKSPYHPYTHALMESSPSLHSSYPAKSLLKALPGSIPPLQHLPIGCRLGPRCPKAQKQCVCAPEMRKLKGHQVSCHFPMMDFSFGDKS